MSNNPNGQKFFSNSTIALILIILVIVGVRVSSEFDKDEARVAGSLPENLDYQEVEALYDTLRSKYNGEISEDDLVDGLKAGLVDGVGDRYTSYLTDEEAIELEESLNGQFSGIGAELGVEEDFIVIVAPIDNFPAQKAGIQTGDKIISVDGESIVGETVEKAVSLIRGEVGTVVDLTIRRVNETLDISVTREQIDLPSVTWELRDDNIGYLRISSFAEDTASLAKEAILEFNGANVEGVIVDVRNNGGGILDITVELAGLWLDGSVVVKQDSKNDYINRELKASDGKTLNDGIETVVLINGGSASASEILAAALRENGVATVVGETSFGKGTVQEISELKNEDGYLKVTVAEWLTPNGNEINGVGVSPDVEVIYDVSSEEDNQLDEAAKQIKSS